ncbi:MAG TPA: YrhB domain-containing protein [Phycisphaerae bacterium]|nr:YrhB domain-containing protein [Phycisphaerae bacterium]
MDDPKVLTKQEAEAIVRAHLERISKSGPRGVEVEIVSDATIERPFGWVFFYNSVEFL